MLYFKGKISRNLVPAAGVLILTPALNYRLHFDFIDSTFLEFVAIRRKMVSNLVSNALRAKYPPRVPYLPIGLPYMYLT